LTVVAYRLKQERAYDYRVDPAENHLRTTETQSQGRPAKASSVRHQGLDASLGFTAAQAKRVRELLSTDKAPTKRAAAKTKSPATKKSDKPRVKFRCFFRISSEIIEARAPPHVPTCGFLLQPVLRWRKHLIRLIIV
jgi:hypothetical protein